MNSTDNSTTVVTTLVSGTDAGAELNGTDVGSGIAGVVTLTLVEALTVCGGFAAALAAVCVLCVWPLWCVRDRAFLDRLCSGGVGCRLNAVFCIPVLCYNSCSIYLLPCLSACLSSIAECLCWPLRRLLPAAAAGAAGDGRRKSMIFPRKPRNFNRMSSPIPFSLQLAPPLPV